ncbi:mobile mystery protein B [Leucothrix arctica]|uniref:Mobile mystery protein B n=1 Tax=Leucothrix arctica TaxID=1481894 RepID=A0A317CFL5_9GAMM|nr:mobile mystery protein B [Leucothrix arctica]PWQ97296.1 mobile mystery protein B [Leucothrix arctica]
MIFEYPEGSTPLNADESAGLIPQHITIQSELNTWEEANIIEGERWALRQKKAQLLTEGFVRSLHKKMFDQTWEWAGTFRSSNKNIGVEWSQVSMQLRNLLDNAQYQLDNDVYPEHELAVRLHHQLVFIHPFPNGNGRRARLLADLLLVNHGEPRLTWGSRTTLTASGDVRKQYIEALRAADRGDITMLLEFSST